MEFYQGSRFLYLQVTHADVDTSVSSASEYACPEYGEAPSIAHIRRPRPPAPPPDSLDVKPYQISSLDTSRSTPTMNPVRMGTNSLHARACTIAQLKPQESKIEQTRPTCSAMTRATRSLPACQCIPHIYI